MIELAAFLALPVVSFLLAAAARLEAAIERDLERLTPSVPVTVGPRPAERRTAPQAVQRSPEPVSPQPQPGDAEPAPEPASPAKEPAYAMQPVAGA